MPGVLRVATAGSVDDGKSTLLGRLLCETDAIAEDQLSDVRRASAAAGHAAASLDLSYVTDGLRAEREQGITIDVAYRHLRTARHRFLLADSPGHVEYTRNMATAASTAHLLLLLVDARHGPLEQSHRHAAIAALFGVRRILVAINKMDLVENRCEVFEGITAALSPVLAQLGFESCRYIPVSALRGDNVTRPGDAMPWYHGPTLLDALEQTAAGIDARTTAPLRLPLQCVLRPAGGPRLYAGRIASGNLHPGHRVLVLPSGVETTIAAVRDTDQPVDRAAAPATVAVELTDSTDAGRGSLLASAGDPPHVSRTLRVRLLWLSPSSHQPGGSYHLKHTTRLTTARITTLHHLLALPDLHPLPPRPPAVNDIVDVDIKTRDPLCFDAYSANRETGSLILIDRSTNDTVAAGMILDAAASPAGSARPLDHTGLTVWLTGLSGAGKTTLAEAVAADLTARGCRVERLDGDDVRRHLSKDLGFSPEDRQENIRRIGFVAGLLTRHGVITLVSAISPYRQARSQVRTAIGGAFFEVWVNAPLDVCESRDPKGLYARARQGALPAFTGIDDPYEPPESPDLELRTDLDSPETCRDRLVAAILARL